MKKTSKKIAVALLLAVICTASYGVISNISKNSTVKHVAVDENIFPPEPRCVIIPSNHTI